jgi:hypothetical protein
VRIVLRADSGFASEDMMVWCEENGIHYIGLAENLRLTATIADELGAAAARWRTAKPNPRFVVASLSRWRRPEALRRALLR